LYSRYLNSFHNKISNFCRPSQPVFSIDQKRAISALRNDPNIVVTCPDKGIGGCVLNRTDYISKMRLILND